MLKIALSVLASGAWIGASEFFRNELLFKGLWLEHYARLGVPFPSSLANNAVWGLWSFALAGCLVFLSRRLNAWETAGLGWVMAFVLMWLSLGNLGVLPFALLWYAVPLSLLEVGLATVIAFALKGNEPSKT